MRREKRWRYYCDHCKKSGGSGGHIAKHERGCTMNPARVCGMCKAAEIEQQPMSVLTAAFVEFGLNGLQAAAEGCPACTLAGIRQSPMPETMEPFDFKAETTMWWRDLNEREAKMEGHRGAMCW